MRRESWQFDVRGRTGNVSYSCRVSRILLLASVFLCLAAAQTTSLTIKGDLQQEVVLKPEDMAQMTRETVSIPDPDGTKVAYEGVPLREVLKRAGVPSGKDLRGKALASYIVAKGHDGYQVVFSLGEIDAAFGNESILVADKRDGKPLFGYQGPLRLVCPNDKAGARSVRMLETIELVRLQK